MRAEDRPPAGDDGPAAGDEPQDLDARLQAVRSCGLEMVAMRRELEAKDAQIARLRAEAARRDALQETLQAAGGGVAADRSSARLRALAAACAGLEQERGVLAAELAVARRSLAALKTLETQHAELQAAHVAQAALVQRLQRGSQQAEALRRAVRVQERVIRQFEQAVGAQRPSGRPRGRPEPIEDGDGDGDGDEQARGEAAAVRVRALERQLEANARAAAAEASALRLRVAELELVVARAPRP